MTFLKDFTAANTLLNGNNMTSLLFNIIIKMNETLTGTITFNNGNTGSRCFMVIK